jgi:hypothetical protein
LPDEFLGTKPSAARRKDNANHKWNRMLLMFIVKNTAGRSGRIEAALSLAVFTYNLSVLFQRHLGWLDRVSIGTFRFRLFSTTGIIGHSHGQLTIKLEVEEVEIEKSD